MVLDEIDREAEWDDDARDEPDPRGKPYFSRWTISGKLNQEDWGEVEYYLSNFGIRIEEMVDA